MNTSHDNQSIALAFAVAALQHGESSFPGSNIPQSIFEEQRHTMTHTEILETSSHASPTVPTGQEQAISRRPKEGWEQRLAKSRERNREHARRTRIRKKEHLEALQSKVRELEAERKNLKQKMEECNIASILLGMSSNEEEPHNDVDVDMFRSKKERKNETHVTVLTEGKRKRFFVESNDYQFSSKSMKVSIDGELTILGGGCHVNWKTGVYSDNKGFHKTLTNEQLQKLRRERNRMHAKLTRDRKKCFISVLEKTVEDLEMDIQTIRETLARVSVSGMAPTSQIVTPSRSPIVSPTLSHQEPEDDVSAYSMDPQPTSAAISVQHAPRNGIDLSI
ncbi:hypothetical protein FisN_9Lh300 [Fistulifera solaris]|uniref:BZIP domain-containing protein n=1 Tax=Fistulifera solaris TaxID=1519565 RepID=A0A1Z5KLQ2_FISSO|nr:hypothetical protein FisN_9Lh300 [Fistulifera solaris]|eukprot:GAX26992.1 hypothetical protein FisN_9Lh300 [Fistulifera solaris]